METTGTKHPECKKYTDSLFYEIFLTGKYIKKMAEQILKKLKTDITPEEFSAIDFLYENKNPICQRDLALMMLINRANMGKILSNLEKKGYIKIVLSEKCNRPVKMASLTEKGEKLYIKMVEIFKKHSANILEMISLEESNQAALVLQKLRASIDKIIELNI